MKPSTLLINLWASPSCGKSTLAAGLFHKLKVAGTHAELITEHAKTYAWEGRTISQIDQIRLMAEQSIAEERLIGKVDVAITDSPSLLGAFYDEYYTGHSITLAFLKELRERRLSDKTINEINLFLPRREKYDERGRFQTASEAAEVHTKLKAWMHENEIPFVELDSADVDVVLAALKELVTYV